MNTNEVLTWLEQRGNEKNREGMARFGIHTSFAYGIKIPVLRAFAKEIGTNHSLALSLWQTGMHEARLLAVFIADPKQVTEALLENWVKDVNSWDLCDQTCGNLFDRTPFAFSKAVEWSAREEEFQKRAGFVLMATTAVHCKKTDDKAFLPFFACMERESYDARNFVKKAINWALRQIGKRSPLLNKEAISVAQRIQLQEHKSAKWIAADALRELLKYRKDFGMSDSEM